MVVAAVSALAIRSGGADHRPSLPLYDYVVVGGGLRSRPPHAPRDVEVARALIRSLGGEWWGAGGGSGQRLGLRSRGAGLGGLDTQYIFMYMYMPMYMYV